MSRMPGGTWNDRGSGIQAAFNPIPVRSDPSRVPSPRRLRRIVDQWLPVGHAAVAARVTVLRHGGHARPVITRGSKHLRFRFTSVKTRTTQLGEGKGERFLARYNEVSARVVDYECHPFQIALMRDGRLRTYRPDSVRMLDDGTVELLECKRTHDDLADADYRELLAAIAEIARICGWSFRVLHLNQIVGPAQRRLNVDALFGSRTLALDGSEDRIARRMVGRGAPIAWGDLRDRLAPCDALHGDAIVERLLARGQLSADLDQTFTPDTVLVPAKPFTGSSKIRL